MHHGKRVAAISPTRLDLPFAEGLAPPAGARVVFDAPEPVRHPEFSDALHVTGFRPAWDRVVAGHGRVALSAPEGAAALALVCVPRVRARALARVAEALRALAPGGWLLIDGQKTDGVEALVKAVRAVLPVTGVAAKAHGKILWMPRPDTLPAELARWEAQAAPRPLDDGTLIAPGMFSADGIDPATELLIRHIPADAEGPAADLGAGWGALARALLARAPGVTACDLVEADHASAEAARANVTDSRARVHWADAARWDGGPYRLILSNPPFHAGRAADPALGQAFIATAARCLHPKGRFLMVANRQLPYEATLEAHFRRWEPVHTDTRLKIIGAALPRRDRRAA